MLHFLPSFFKYKVPFSMLWLYDIIIMYTLFYCCNWTHVRASAPFLSYCSAIRQAIVTLWQGIPGSKSLFAFCKQRAFLLRMIQHYVQHLFAIITTGSLGKIKEYIEDCLSSRCSGVGELYHHIVRI